jgi:hypothetical protein
MCTRSEDYYSLYLQNKTIYLWVANHWTDECDYESINGATFRAVIQYMERLKKAPESIDAMLQFVIHNPHNIKEFERSEGLSGEMRELKDYEPAREWDDTTLFEGLIEKAREEWFTHKAKYAIQLAHGSVKLPNSDESGVTVASQWLRSELLNDLHTEVPAVAGILHENIPAVLAGLDEMGTDAATTGRFPLGFSQIDNNVVVGKQNLRFLGVLGMSGDGKTTLTNFIVYNWLTQGAHVLYCSTEHNPQEIWNAMCFLHQSHPDYIRFAARREVLPYL